jgi:hypothetical protein
MTEQQAVILTTHINTTPTHFAQVERRESVSRNGAERVTYVVNVFSVKTARQQATLR